MRVKNFVELGLGEDEMAFNQKCKHGNLVFGHAVYCHSQNPDAPRKCRRSWETQGLIKDEDCPFYEQNPNFKKDGDDGL